MWDNMMKNTVKVMSKGALSDEMGPGYALVLVLKKQHVYRE